MEHLKAIFWTPKLPDGDVMIQFPKKTFSLKHRWLIVMGSDVDVLGMFEKDLSNARIRVFFGQEQEGVRHSTFTSIKDREGGVKN